MVCETLGPYENHQNCDGLFGDAPWAYSGRWRFQRHQIPRGTSPPCVQADDTVVVDLDGVEGYGSSFLDEAFGGLVRKGYFTEAQLKEKLTIRYSDPDLKLYRDSIWNYIHESKPE